VAPGKRHRNWIDSGGGKSSIHELDLGVSKSGSIESGQVAEPNRPNPGDGSRADKGDTGNLVGAVVCSSLSSLPFPNLWFYYTTVNIHQSIAWLIDALAKIIRQLKGA
jgi:hypothetical protein